MGSEVGLKGENREGGQPALEVVTIRLHLAEPTLSQRLGGDAEALSGYIRGLEKAADHYWAQVPQPASSGLLITVGVKPGKRCRVWCDAVGAAADADVLAKCERELGSVPPMDVHGGPIAFALWARFRGKAVDRYPAIPKVWEEAAKKAKRPLSIPDELLEEVWAD